MAGIAGIIHKQLGMEKDGLPGFFASMMRQLAISDSQPSRRYTAAGICFGNALPVSCRKNDHFQSNDDLRIHAVIDGMVFVNRHERSILAVGYHTEGRLSDYQLIPYLYDYYKEISYYISPDGLIFSFMMNKKKSSLLIQ